MEENSRRDWLEEKQKHMDDIVEGRVKACAFSYPGFFHRPEGLVIPIDRGLKGRRNGLHNLETHGIGSKMTKIGLW